MSKKLNIQPQTVPQGTVLDLLNGAFASLSGPVGFTASQPRIFVKGISVTAVGGSQTGPFTLFKGASGGSTSGTQVLEGSVAPGTTIEFALDLVLDAADFLTGTAQSSGLNPALVVNITAEIDF